MIRRINIRNHPRNGKGRYCCRDSGRIRSFRSPRGAQNIPSTSRRQNVVEATLKNITLWFAENTKGEEKAILEVSDSETKIEIDEGSDGVC